MKLERLEVRLRPKNPAEQELIMALEAQDGIYGGKNELMRECLRRGYAALKQTIERLSSAGDEIATLDAMAQTVESGEYGYRIIKTYLDAQNQAKAGSDGHHAGKVSAAPIAAGPVQSAAQPPSIMTEVLEAQQPTVKTALDTEAPKQPELPAGPAPTTSEGEDAPKRKVDWSRMRGLAGSGGGQDGGA